MATHPRLAGIGPRALELVAPDPVARPISDGIPVPIPTIPEDDKRNKRTKQDLDLRAASDEPRKTSDASDTPEARPLNEGFQPAPEDSPFPWGRLVSDSSDRVRLHTPGISDSTRLPATSSSKGASQTNQLTDAQQLSMWKRQGRSNTEPQPEQPRG